jgi:hypothetical protein
VTALARSRKPPMWRCVLPSAVSSHGISQLPAAVSAHGISQKKKKGKSDAPPTYLPFLGIFELFRSDFREKHYGVFGLLMQRNGRKRDKTKSMGKDERKKGFFSSTFSARSF